MNGQTPTQLFQPGNNNTPSVGVPDAPSDGRDSTIRRDLSSQRASHTPINTQHTSHTSIFKGPPASATSQPTNAPDREPHDQGHGDSNRLGSRAAEKSTNTETTASGHFDDNQDQNVPDDGDPCDEQLEQYQILLNHERELLLGMPLNDDPTAETSTWAKRQPTTIGIQQVRSRQYRPKTHAERQTENMRRERIKENAEALQTEVKAFHNLRDKMVKDLTSKFRKKEAYIRVLLCSHLLSRQRTVN
ncbi:hypothetical protein F5887DRAFT_1075000 [Amanita rubescens]|nr:hypothetical protein F5887DRAFT_1075000 [Amanita rubescens]